jgi:hypothetical protein
MNIQQPRAITSSIALLFLLATATLASGCVTAGGIASPAGPSSTAAGSMPAASASSSDDGCGSIRWSVEYAPYTVATLAQSGIFVVGTVNAVEPAIFNTSDGKRPRGFAKSGPDVSPQPNGKIFTPVVLKVDTVLSGNVKAGAVSVLVEGGSVGCVTELVDQGPNLETKGRYVFVLGAAFDADAKVLPNALEMKLAWPIDGNGIVQTVDGPMSIDSLSAAIRQGAAASPVPAAVAS